ncbi:unnamed protein product [Calypogeia fissa]
MKHAARVLRLVRVHTQGGGNSAAIRGLLYYRHRPSHLPIQQEWTFVDSNLPSSRVAFDNFTTSRIFSSSLANPLPSSIEEDAARAAERGPMAVYEREIASGHLKPGDKYQEDALRALQALHDALHSAADEAGLERNSNRVVKSSAGGWFSYLMPKVQWRAQPSVRGLYLYGGVGTGKTMLMDMFFEELPKTWRKRRIHFHDFMLEVHSQLQKTRSQADPLALVADDTANDATLLCIDEFMVTDVADALILNRLFDHLFRKGIILVSTSNRHPDQLYEGGLQRDLFLPFIASLKARCVIHEIGSGTDYRKLTAAEQGMYFTGPDAAYYLREKFSQITSYREARPATVELRMGRTLQVPLGAAGCAYFQFHELCEMPLGAADYFGLFKYFHTLALEGVPFFGSHNQVSAYRFVTLVDVMYEHKARFLCSAEGTPFQLFEKVTTLAAAPRKSSSRSSRHEDADLLVDNELGFAKDRTISRLTEINSTEYQENHAAANGNRQQRLL